MATLSAIDVVCCLLCGNGPLLGDEPGLCSCCLWGHAEDRESRCRTCGASTTRGPLMDEPEPARRDSKGHLVGRRSSEEKGKFPKRNEGGLCPGLEATMRDVADYIDGLVTVAHMDHPGPWESCGRGPCAPIRFAAERLRAALGEWAESS